MIAPRMAGRRKAVLTLRVPALIAVLVISCGTAVKPDVPSDASAPNSVPSSAVATATVASSVAPSQPPTVTSACPSAGAVARTAAPPPTPIAPFGGSGGSKMSAAIESVDPTARRITVTFSNSSTGGLASDAPRSFRATLRVTGSSVMQDVVTSRLPLAAAVARTETKIALSPGAPAMPAKAQVFIVSLDACQAVVVRQPATLAQPAAAGAAEWSLAAPVGTAFPAGAFVVVSAFKSIQFADLRPGDPLLSANPSAPFGLVFSGAAPDFVLTRLIRACYDVPCPFAPE